MSRHAIWFSTNSKRTGRSCYLRLSTGSDLCVSRFLDHGVLALSYTRELYQLSRWDATNLVQNGTLENSNERDGVVWKDQGSWYSDDFVVDKISIKKISGWACWGNNLTPHWLGPCQANWLDWRSIRAWKGVWTTSWASKRSKTNKRKDTWKDIWQFQQFKKSIWLAISSLARIALIPNGSLQMDLQIYLNPTWAASSWATKGEINGYFRPGSRSRKTFKLARNTKQLETEGPLENL